MLIARAAELRAVRERECHACVRIVELTALGAGPDVRDRPYRRRSLILGGLAVLLVGPFVANPLRLPDTVIESYLLREVPLGSASSDVHQLIARHGWELASYHEEDSGFVDRSTRPRTVVGESSIRASLGNYWGLPFEVNVTVFWGFDAEERLIGIGIWRTANGL